jgi:hypothetical protein
LWVENLVWADAERLVFSFGQYRGGDADSDMDQNSGSDGAGLLVWDPDQGDAPSRVPGVDGDVEFSTGSGQLWVDGAHRSIWVDLDAPGSARRFDSPHALGAHTMAADADGTSLAAPLGNRNPAPVSVLRVRSDGSTTAPRVVPDSGRTFAVRSWLDDDHVAADRRRGAGIGPSALYDVDVRTGASAEILRFPDDTYGTQTLLATDLLDAPTATRSPPPRPFDPRTVVAAESAVVLIGLLALVLWRRRVRP